MNPINVNKAENVAINLEKLKTITDFNEYISCIRNDPELVIAIAVKDTPTRNSSQKHYYLQFDDLFNSDKKPELFLFDKFRASFIGVTNATKPIYYKFSVTEKQEYNFDIDGTSWHIVSAGYAVGNTAEIIISGKDYSLNLRGLNIVVYDKVNKKVIDSVCFDSYNNFKKYSNADIRTDVIDNISVSINSEIIQDNNTSISKKPLIGILGFTCHNNIGGCLTVAASYKFIQSLTTAEVKLIREWDYGDGKKMNKIRSDTWNCNKKFGMTPSLEVADSSTYESLNKHFSTFITVSDWTFANKINRAKDWVFMQKFVDDNKKKISLASSFGRDNGFNQFEPEEKKLVSSLLKRFNNLSLREESHILQLQNMGIDAHWVCDPVFCVGMDFYNQLAQLNSDTERFIPDKPYLLCYDLSNNLSTVMYAKKIADRLGLDLILVAPHFKPEYLPQLEPYVTSEHILTVNYADWVYYALNSAFTISGSFHFTCLSLIFGKPFIVVPRFANERMKFLLNSFGMTERFVTDISEESAESLSEEFLKHDYDRNKVNSTINSWRNQATEYLKNALEDSVIPVKNISDVKSDCTGCGACYNICPVNAIEMQPNDEGFLYPHIAESKSKCTNCGLCRKACAVIQGVDKTDKYQESDKKVFCGYSKNEDTRYMSTSGGAFSEIATAFFADGGNAVYGVGYETPYIVKHMRVESVEELPIIRQSKYVQSEIGSVYTEIKNSLKANQKIMFCGCPCQCAGLSAYLKIADVSSENLTLIDFICHSVNSPLAYSKYLWELEDYFKGKITRVWFKNKEHSWNNFSTRVDFDKKISFEGNDEYYIRNRYTDNFYKGFLKYHLFSRSSCYDCNFKGHNRTADLTLADAWGITLRFNGADNKHGISTAIVNSDKGKILLDKTSENFIMEEHTLAEVKKGNLNFDNCVKKGQYSEYFYEQLRAGKRFSSIITNITNLTAKEKSGVPITTPTIIIPKNNSWDDLIAQKKIIIYGKNGINIDPNAKLNIGGRLSINVDVVGEADNCCQILVQKGATLEVRGNFKLYFNNYIKVFPGAKLTLGSGYINRNGSITCSNSISIGDGCVIAPYVKILDSDFHTIMDENGVRINPPAPVVIEDHCWIGYDVTIMKGVTIGTGSVIGAGSVVNKSIPPHSLAVGVPAKVVKENITWK